MSFSYSKLILCKSFKSYGVCPSGGSCNFAHGDDEIKRTEAKLEQHFYNKAKEELEKEFQIRVNNEIIRRKEEKKRLKQEKIVKEREQLDKQKSINSELEKKYPTISGFLDNIIEQNKSMIPPIDISSIINTVYTYGLIPEKWNMIIVECIYILKKMLADYMHIDHKDVTEGTLIGIKTKLDEYIHVCDTNCFFNVLQKSIDSNNRHDVEETLIYFRRSMEMLQKFRNIDNTPKENRRVYLHVKHREKTVLCRNFNRQGGCKLGKSCKFAHSIEEQQSNISKLDDKLKSMKEGNIIIVKEEDTNPISLCIEEEPQEAK